MAVDEAVAARILVRCARHCCICRRYLPLYVQVHHIVPRSEGGSDDEDNLIAVCLMCHCDVHAQLLFTRRFSVAELKGHRDMTYAMAEKGILRAGEAPGAVAAATNAAIQSAPMQVEKEVRLSPEQVEILLTAARGTGYKQGHIEIIMSQVEMGDTIKVFQNAREGAAYREAFTGLLRYGVLDGVEGIGGGNTEFQLNAEAFRWVDQILAQGNRARK